MFDPVLKKELISLITGIGQVMIITIPASVARTLVGTGGNFWSLVRTTFLGTFVGFFASGVLADYNMSPGLSGALIALAALTANDILALVLNIAKKISNDPEGIFIKHIKPLLPGGGAKAETPAENKDTSK